MSNQSGCCVKVNLFYQESICHHLDRSASVVVIIIPRYLFPIYSTYMYLYNFFIGHFSFHLDTLT